MARNVRKEHNPIYIINVRKEHNPIYIINVRKELNPIYIINVRKEHNPIYIINVRKKLNPIYIINVQKKLNPIYIINVQKKLNPIYIINVRKKLNPIYIIMSMVKSVSLNVISVKVVVFRNLSTTLKGELVFTQILKSSVPNLYIITGGLRRVLQNVHILTTTSLMILYHLNLPIIIYTYAKSNTILNMAHSCVFAIVDCLYLLTKGGGGAHICLITILDCIHVYRAIGRLTASFKDSCTGEHRPNRCFGRGLATAYVMLVSFPRARTQQT